MGRIVSSIWNGTPWSKLPNATPKMIGGTAEPMKSIQSQLFLQRVAETLER